MISSRYYNPRCGLFLQPADVAGLDPTAINGLTLYSCTNYNPINIAYNNSNIGINACCDTVKYIANYVYSGGISGSLSSPRNLPGIPGWVERLSTGLDHAFTMINPIRSAISCLRFTNLWDLMRLDGITELPGTLSKVATGIGLGLSVLGGILAGYEKYVSGASVISSIVGGLINAGISIGGCMLQQLWLVRLWGFGGFIIGNSRRCYHRRWCNNCNRSRSWN